MLASEYGFTPQEVSAMTMPQVLAYLTTDEQEPISDKAGWARVHAICAAGRQAFGAQKPGKGRKKGKR